MARTASPTTTDGALPAGSDLPAAQRLRREDRKAELVGSAAALLAQSGLDAVSMDRVAAHAGVSRPLVYKYFANRHELLAEVFRQQAAELDATIATAVLRADGFESKIRALVRAVLDAVHSHGPILTPLLRAGASDASFRRAQRERDRRTLRFFADLAREEFRLDEAQATAAMGVLLTGLESVRAQWRSRSRTRDRQLLEDLYVDLVLGGLTRLAEHPSRS